MDPREVWAGALLSNFQDVLVLGNLVNRDYIGDASNAAVVHVQNPDSVAIKPYTGTVQADSVTGNTIDINIDQKHYFAFATKTIELIQMDMNDINETTLDAAYGFAKVADTYLGKAIAAGNPISGSEATPLQLTKDTVIDEILKLGTALGKAGAPGPRIVVVPEFVQALLQGKLLTIDPQFVMSNGTPVNGYLGKLGSVNIFVSENVPKDDDYYKMIGFVRKAVTFAPGINRIEIIPNPTDFGGIIRGQFVFGGKVLKSTGTCNSVICE